MEIHVAGRNPSPEEIDRTKSMVQEHFEFGKTRIDGESPKTSQQTQLVNNVNLAYKLEFVDLGINHLFAPIDSRSVHFLSPEVFNAYLPDSPSVALEVPEYREIIIIDSNDRLDYRSKTFVLLHEAAHLFSHKQFYIDVPTGRLQTQKAGFLVEAPGQTKFSALDEAMCDLSAKTIQWKNFELFFGPNAQIHEINPLMGTYPKEIELVEDMIEKISEHKKESPLETWNRFYRALFTGDMSVLRDIEEVMGNGYVKMLANLEIARDST